MPSASPAALRALGEYESALADVQRAYKRLAATRGDARIRAQAEYDRAMSRAREMGARARGTLDARAA